VVAAAETEAAADTEAVVVAETEAVADETDSTNFKYTNASFGKHFYWYMEMSICNKLVPTQLKNFCLLYPLKLQYVSNQRR